MRHVFRDPVPAPTSALSPMAVAPKSMQSVTLQICAFQYPVPAPTFVPMIPTAFVSFAGTVSSILARTAMMAIPEAMTAAHHSVLARYLLQAWLSAATESPTRASSVMMAIFAREMAAPIPASAKRSWWQEQLSVVTARFPPPRRVMMATSFPVMVAPHRARSNRRSMLLRICVGTECWNLQKSVTITICAMATVARHPAAWSAVSVEMALCSARWMKSANPRSTIAGSRTVAIRRYAVSPAEPAATAKWILGKSATQAERIIATCREPHVVTTVRLRAAETLSAICRNTAMTATRSTGMVAQLRANWMPMPLRARYPSQMFLWVWPTSMPLSNIHSRLPVRLPGNFHSLLSSR